MSERMVGSDTAELQRLRTEIDSVDNGLLNLIAARRDLALEIGRVKRKHGLELRDHAREAAVVRRSAKVARELGLESEVVRDVFWRLIALSHWALMSLPLPAGEGEGV